MLDTIDGYGLFFDCCCYMSVCNYLVLSFAVLRVHSVVVYCFILLLVVSCCKLLFASCCCHLRCVWCCVLVVTCCWVVVFVWLFVVLVGIARGGVFFCICLLGVC